MSTDARPGAVHAGGRTRQAPCEEAAFLLGRRVAVAAWCGIPPSTVRRLAGGGTTCTLRCEVRQVPSQRVEHVPPLRRRRDAAVGGGSGVVTGRTDSLAAGRPVVRDCEGRARHGVGPDIFFWNYIG